MPGQTKINTREVLYVIMLKMMVMKDI